MSSPREASCRAGAAGSPRQRGQRHIHDLPGRLDEVPAGDVWVYCGSGYRASIAASMLARAGRRPVLVNGSYGDPDTGAAAAGLHAQPAAA